MFEQGVFVIPVELFKDILFQETRAETVPVTRLFPLVNSLLSNIKSKLSFIEPLTQSTVG